MEEGNHQACIFNSVFSVFGIQRENFVRRNHSRNLARRFIKDEKLRLFCSQSLGDATALLRRYGTKARLLAGGTDHFIRLERRVVEPGILVDLKKIRALQGIKASAKGLTIRAATLMDEIVSSRLVQRRYGIVAEAAGAVGSIQTRNRATLGGNLCNASPAADTAPALIALGRGRASPAAGASASCPGKFSRSGQNLPSIQQLLKYLFLPGGEIERVVPALHAHGYGYSLGELRSFSHAGAQGGSDRRDSDRLGCGGTDAGAGAIG
jgi:hypothetical protein